MARHRAAPDSDVELLAFDAGDGEDDDEPEERGSTGGPGKGLLVLMGAAAVVLAVAALIGRSEVPDPASLLPPPTVPRAGPTTLPPAYAVAAADHRSVVVSGGLWEAPLEVDPALGEITSVAGGRGFVVATFANGHAVRWSATEPDGFDIGPGELVVANAREVAVAWLVATADGRQSVRTVAVPPEHGGPPVPVPSGWRVVGAHDRGLVLVRAESGKGVALWEPWDRRGPEVLDPDGYYLASGSHRVAWLRDGQLVESARPFRDERFVVLDAPASAAVYAPDGVQLALIGAPEGGSTRVRFLESDGSVDEGFVVRSEDGISTYGWLADGAFVADPGGDVEYRYNPRWGLIINDRRLLG